MTSEMRRQVMARIIEVGAAAGASGDDPWTAMQMAFPGLPVSVLVEAWVEVGAAEAERWWASVETTIDAELVKRAIAIEGDPK